MRVIVAVRGNAPLVLSTSFMCAGCHSRVSHTMQGWIDSSSRI